MTNEMITKWVKTAKIISTMRGTAWLMSNGKELIVAETEENMESKRDVFGYWVSMIFENGHQVEA